ncbi:mitochondrial 37S ribosomal protein uS11m [Calcarisporiella thermophila]|uniref:mitochondrial 37S ribosomal protein uS11m n=1 Tax=Calcarisporiella thermophila TaxID=911321 RepID=UPI0037437ABF
MLPALLSPARRIAQKTALYPLSAIQAPLLKCWRTTNSNDGRPPKAESADLAILDILDTVSRKPRNRSIPDAEHSGTAATLKQAAERQKQRPALNFEFLNAAKNSYTPAAPTTQSHTVNIHASFNNTIITLTSSDGSPVISTSGGTAGFRKAQRGGYEAAHQAAMQLIGKAAERNLQVHDVHIVMKGFGPGRDAAFKAIVGNTEWRVRRITDGTPVPFNGCRPRKVRRL